MNLKEIG